jgi:hypothetical protein
MSAGAVDFSWVPRKRCPLCGGRGHIGLLTPYSRRVVELFPHWEERILVARFRCNRTGRTFSLLPLELAPYHVYTVPTMLRVLALFHVLFGDPGRSLESIINDLPSDCVVTVYLIRCWSRMMVRGFRRSHPTLTRLHELRYISSGLGLRGEVSEVDAYLGACSARGPPPESLPLLRSFRDITQGMRFLFGTASQDRG